MFTVLVNENIKK